MNILVVAAHPDDEVLGCGGTIPRLVNEGHDVYIAILGEGITSRYEQREEANPDLLEVLHNDSLQVAQVLGAKDLFLYKLPDNRFDTVPLLDVIQIIEGLIEKLEPGVIYTHHNGDLNIDHVITHRAVLTATRPMVNQPVQEIYTFGVPSSTEWAFQTFKTPFCPNVFMDISNTLETKIDAMALYESEMRSFPHPRSAKALRVMAQRWASVVGCQAVEAFELIRAIR
jgi:LmbE family N-acetylglucosaminyl deacetylase